MASPNRLSLEEDPIVVTGMGCVTPLGMDVQSTWDGLMAGRDGFINLREETKLLDDYSKDAIQAEVAAPIREALDVNGNPLFDNSDLKKRFKRSHRSTQFALWAAAQATEQAALLGEVDGVPVLHLHSEIDPSRVSVFNGTGIGGATDLIGIHSRLKRGSPVLPSMTLQAQPERVGSVLSMQLGSRGPTAVILGACATGNMNIINGAWALELGKTDVAIVGGAEAAILPEALGMFDGTTAMDRTTDPAQASRPFHQDERGFIMGEGAGILVLERESHAKKRGAIILARLAGTGWTSDAYNDTEPDPEGVSQAAAMDEALKEAASFIGPDSSGTVNTHGTATEGDKFELGAMAKSQIRHTGNGEVTITSTKSAMGHLIGAAGAVESIVCVKAINEKQVPQTLKYSPETAVDAAKAWDVVYDEPRVVPNLSWALNNSFGFGGYNGAALFTIPELLNLKTT